jgi:hypothetical protein
MNSQDVLWLFAARTIWMSAVYRPRIAYAGQTFTTSHMIYLWSANYAYGMPDFLNILSETHNLGTDQLEESAVVL